MIQSCYLPEKATKEQSIIVGKTNSQIGEPRTYSHEEWKELFVQSEMSLQSIEKLHKFLQIKGLEENYQKIMSLLSGEMKNSTFNSDVDYTATNKQEYRDHNYYIFNSDKSALERNVMALTILGYTKNTIFSLLQKHNINVFKNAPKTVSTIRMEGVLTKEIFSSLIVVAEIIKQEDDLTPQDGYRSTMTINIIEILKGSASKQQIMIRCFNGGDPDGGATVFTHTPEDFISKLGSRYIFYLSKELYEASIYAPLAQSEKTLINTKLKRQEFYTMRWFHPFIIPDSVDIKQHPEVLKSINAAKILQSIK